MHAHLSLLAGGVALVALAAFFVFIRTQVGVSDGRLLYSRSSGEADDDTVNQVYMAGLMKAPMIGFELILMKSMYKDRRLNLLAGALALVPLVGLFSAIRAQLAVSDFQFLRSMIPHHAGAILRCEQAPIDAPDVQDLYRRILASQPEIDEMKVLLEISTDEAAPLDPDTPLGYPVCAGFSPGGSHA